MSDKYEVVTVHGDEVQVYAHLLEPKKGMLYLTDTDGQIVLAIPEHQVRYIRRVDD